MPTIGGAVQGCGLVLAILVAGSSVLLYHASTLPSYQLSALDPRVTRFKPHHLDAFAGFDWPAATERLAAALRIKTVSVNPKEVISGPGFLALRQLYERSYPLLHATLKREIINDYSLLYEWRGSLADDNAQGNARPYLLMSHMDVVPAANDTLRDWESEPFAGHILDGYLYGRGAIDVKQGVSSVLEAVEVLVREGFQPRRTVYLFFGHDEETGGANGAQAASKLLQQRGVVLDFVVDEGGMITQGVMPVTPKPVAVIGIGEKGYVSVDLELRGTGGHSSMPPNPTPIGEMTAALQALEHTQMPATLSATTHLLDFLAPELPFVSRLAVANKGVFESLLISQLGQTVSGNANLRTTTAPTMLSASAKDNVLPAVVKATVNFRLLPGDTVADVVAHVTRVIANPKITVKIWDASAQEASPMSDPHSPQFGLLQATLKQLKPEVLVAPYLVIGGTDARFFRPICNNVFRFIPYLTTASDLSRYHGINERISLRDIETVIRWQYQLIRNADAS